MQCRGMLTDTLLELHEPHHHVLCGQVQWVLAKQLSVEVLNPFVVLVRYALFLGC